MTTASYLSGQEKSAAQAGNASDSSQPVQRDYSFEVASVRPAAPPTGQEYKAGPQGYSPGRFRETNRSLESWVFQAFKLKQGFEIENPRWMESTYFTINATLPEGATKADVPIMLRHMLEDRFGLKYHHETKQMAGYELVVAKSGPKFAKSAGPAPDPSKVKGPGFEMKNGVMQFSKDAGNASGCGPLPGCYFHGHYRTMKALVTDLARALQMPVMDATGLEGGYDYNLIYTPENGAFRGDEPLAQPLLRDALREQLGLELRSAKDVPVNVVIIDSANKKPTDN
jgi:uncharacterized protein (TIGR03435 family)